MLFISISSTYSSVKYFKFYCLLLGLHLNTKLQSKAINKMSLSQYDRLWQMFALISLHTLKLRWNSTAQLIFFLNLFYLESICGYARVAITLREKKNRLATVCTLEFIHFMQIVATRIASFYGNQLAPDVLTKYLPAMFIFVCFLYYFSYLLKINQCHKFAKTSINFKDLLGHKMS